MPIPYGETMKNKEIKHLTNCFLVKRSNGKIFEVCLAMKKRGWGEGWWNGSGGKVEGEESIEEATKREVKEELGVDIKNMEKCGEVKFIWPDGKKYLCYIFLCQKWLGEPEESEEMAPKWFKVRGVPYSKMWVTDKYWLKPILKGKKVNAWFEFKDDKTIRKHEVSICSSK
jgi:8-oxo-dGTP pyrophosphatase MutT (NUDIX family)